MAAMSNRSLLPRPMTAYTSIASSQARADPHESSECSSTKNLAVLWRPFWLRKTVLAILATLFSGLAAALIVLWRTNVSHQGYRPALGTNHYLWAYGPTAILVILLAIWRQVDYCCKVIQPWRELQQGTKPVSAALLLDYLSPLNITSLGRASRRGHYPVVVSIAGFATLKIVILFSTGLIFLTPTTISTLYPITLLTTFNASDFWNSVDNYEMLYDPLGPPAYAPVSGRSVNSYYEFLNGNISKPVGINSDLTYQTFKPELDAHFETIKADLQVFVPNISCEKASATVPVNTSVVEIESDSCSVGRADQSRLQYEGLWGGDCSAGHEADLDIVYELFRVNCSNKDTGLTWGNFTLDTKTPWDIRYALVISNETNACHGEFLEYKGWDMPPARRGVIGDTSIARAVHSVTAVICKVDYFTSDAAVSYNLTSETYEVDRPGPGTHLQNLTGLMLGEMLHAAIFAADRVPLSPTMSGSHSSGRDTLFSLMLRNLDGDLALQRLLSTEVLQQSATRTLNDLAAFFVHDSLLRPANVSTKEQVTYSEERLRMRLTSLWVMFTGFVLLAVLTIVVGALTRKCNIPTSPGAVATSARIVSTSPTLRRALRPVGALRTSQFVSALHDFRFTMTGQFQVLAERQNSVANNVGPKKRLKGDAWIPISMRYPMLCLTFATPLVAIIVLELLYRVSVSKDGIFDTSASENLRVGAAQYISALVVLLIATSFNSLDFTIACFAPFSMLRKGSISSARSLNFDLLGHLPPVALLHSIRAGHAASALSNLCGTIGSVLAIIASGLWFVDYTVPATKYLPAHYASTWDSTWTIDPLTTQDGGARWRLNEILMDTMPWPASSVNHTVIPDVNLTLGDGQYNALTSDIENYMLEVNATRPHLTCNIVADDNILLEHTYVERNDCWCSSMTGDCFCDSSRIENGSSRTRWDIVRRSYVDIVYQTVNVSVSLPLPPGCHDARNNDAHNYSFGTIQARVSEPDATEVSIGAIRDLGLIPYVDGAECPSLAIIAGSIQKDSTAGNSTTVLVCSQRLQTIPITAGYHAVNASSVVRDVRIPLTLDEDRMQYVENKATGGKSFAWKLQPYLSSDLKRFGSVREWTDVGVATSANTGVASSTNATAAKPPVLVFSLPFEPQNTTLSAFMDILVFGPSGMPLQNMTGEANQDKLVRTVSALYNQYMALVIDMHFRQPVPSNLQDTEEYHINATVSTTTARLKVNKASKLALQIMLGVMLLLGLCAVWLTDLRGTLPRNPCPIGSKMGFLAGSELCDSLLGPNAALLQEKDLNKLFEGWLFSLGWWPDAKQSQSETSVGDSSKQERFGIDVGEPARLGFRYTKLWAFRRRIERSRQ